MKARVLLVYPNLMFVTQLPTNIALLSASLKNAGHDVKLFDTTLYKTADKTNDEMRVERMQVRKFNIKDAGIKEKKANIFSDFRNIVKEYKPDLIAVTVVDDTVRMALDLIKKSKIKNIPVLFGGVHAIFNAKKLIQQQEIDVVCTGEGEAVLPELVSRIFNKQDYSDLGNLLVKKNGEVIENKLLKPVDINNLPIEDFSIFEKNRIYRPMQGKMVAAIPINFDRGCPYRCTFCAAPYITDYYKKFNSIYYRRKSLDRIYREMIHFVKHYDVSFFYFNSETFLSMPLSFLKEFSKMYKKFNLPFWCQTRIETINEEKIAILKEMGCARLSVGLEHGNENFRKEILNKNFLNKQVKDAFKIIKSHKIPTSVNNMIGFPDETRELTFDTVNLNRQIQPDAVNGFVFQPYSGTYLKQYSIKKGYLKNSDDFMDGAEGTPVGHSFLDMPQFPRDAIEGMLRTFALYVRMPKKYFPKIKKAERLNSEGDKVLSELREVFFKKYFK